MKNYTKPSISLNDELSEGVYAASGCYSYTVNIHQKPVNGDGIYRIQINGHHESDHTKDKQLVTVVFNLNVRYLSSGGHLVSGDGSNILKIEYSYHQNPTDNIGLGDLVVDAPTGLDVVSVKIED